jgi:hypothetical protein
MSACSVTAFGSLPIPFTGHEVERGRFMIHDGAFWVYTGRSTYSGPSRAHECSSGGLRGDSCPQSAGGGDQGADRGPADGRLPGSRTAGVVKGSPHDAAHPAPPV